jgi:hypothetical protein
MLHDSENRFPAKTGQAAATAATILGVSGLVVKKKRPNIIEPAQKAAK